METFGGLQRGNVAGEWRDAIDGIIGIKGGSNLQSEVRTMVPPLDDMTRDVLKRKTCSQASCWRVSAQMCLQAIGLFEKEKVLSPVVAIACTGFGRGRVIVGIAVLIASDYPFALR